jgi:hypothetical protein
LHCYMSCMLTALLKVDAATKSRVVAKEAQGALTTVITRGGPVAYDLQIGRIPAAAFITVVGSCSLHANVI